MITTADLTSINNDVNGNPRYVFHFLQLQKEGERISYQQAIATGKAIGLGSRKYHTKRYAGGIVFSSYNVQIELDIINNYLNG